MRSHFTITELQYKVQTLMATLSVIDRQKIPEIAQETVKEVMKQLLDPNCMGMADIEEEIVLNSFVALVLAGQLGINLEEKLSQYIDSLEVPSVPAC